MLCRLYFTSEVTQDGVIKNSFHGYQWHNWHNVYLKNTFLKWCPPVYINRTILTQSCGYLSNGWQRTYQWDSHSKRHLDTTVSEMPHSSKKINTILFTYLWGQVFSVILKGVFTEAFNYNNTTVCFSCIYILMYSYTPVLYRVTIEIELCNCCAQLITTPLSVPITAIVPNKI